MENPKVGEIYKSNKKVVSVVRVNNRYVYTQDGIGYAIKTFLKMFTKIESEY